MPNFRIAFMTKNILLKMSVYFQIVFQWAVKLLVKKSPIIQSCNIIRSCAIAWTVGKYQQIRTQIWTKYSTFEGLLSTIEM